MEAGLFSTEGRIRRTIYWGRFLIIFIINVCLEVMLAASRGTNAQLFIILLLVATSVFMLIQAVKRMHDVDKSGWFVLVPFYNLILALTDGTPGRNQYGDDPKERSGGFVCPDCQTVNSPYATQCVTCNRPLVPTRQLVPPDAETDKRLMIFLCFIFASSMISFLFEKLLDKWWEGIPKYISIGINLLWGLAPFLIAFSIRNKNWRTIAIVMAVLYLMRTWYSNIVWLFNF